MRGWMTNYCLRVYVIVTLLCLRSAMVTSLRKENRCMRHYFVETIRHPTKVCESKNVLLARCEGYCTKSRTVPRVSFSPVLYRPFRHHCTCCQAALSVMKAVPLTCQGGHLVFATYRYIVRCACRVCANG
ncbi:hypothetical protein ACOMHN_013782 [Nucella lapillus]